MRVLLLMALLALASPAWATTYYIDITEGNDANNGTAKATPWKHMRGMPTVTAGSVAALHTPAAGNSYIFKGGETWHNANFQWTWSWSGTAVSPIYIGVDATWYTGGAWTRPIFNGDGAVVSGGTDLFLRLSGNYVTLDNFEWTGAYFISGFAFGGTAYINPVLSHDTTITHNYFHGWVNGDTSDLGRAIISNTTNPSPNTNLVVSYNVFDGSDTAEVLADPNCLTNCYGSGMAMYYGPIVHHNVMRYLSNGYIGVAQQFSNNLVEHIRNSINPAGHENGFENVGDPCGTGTLMYSNIIRHTIQGVNIWLNPSANAGCVPSYAWNNLTYDTTAVNVFNIGGASTGNPKGTAYVFNNTMQCGQESGTIATACSTCLSTATCVYKNNHFIVLGNGSGAAVTGTNASEVTNVKQTLAVANAAGYTSAQSPSVYAPTDGADATVGTGTNLTASCGTLPTLCLDTTYAVSYNSTAHTAIVEGRTALARSGVLAWDVGAYMLTAATPIPVAPTNLQAVGVTATRATLIWAPTADGAWSGFYVYRSTESGVTGVRIKTITAASAIAAHSSATQYHETRAMGGTFYYTVTQINTDGTESPISNEVAIAFTGVSRSARQ